MQTEPYPTAPVIQPPKVPVYYATAAYRQYPPYAPGHQAYQPPVPTAPPMVPSYRAQPYYG